MATKMRSNFKCGRCNRTLPYYIGEDGKRHQKWITSDWTGMRYCWPGEGCGKALGKSRKRKVAA